MQSDIISFDLRNVPYFYVAGIFEVTSKWHNKHMYQPGNWEIIFMLEGTLNVQIEKNRFSIQKGQYFLVPPFKNFYGTIPSPIGTKFIWFHFFPTGKVTINDSVEQHNYTTASIPQQAFMFHKKHLVTLAYQLLDLTHNFNNYAVDVAISELLLLVSEDYQISQRHYVNSGKGDNDLIHIKDWIDSHLSEIRSAKQIAEHFNFNVVYLNRIFKRQFHYTLYQYVINQKVELAKFLLSTTNETIYSISKATYFNDAKNFTRTFKMKTGITPSHYRRIITQQNLRTPTYDPVMPVSDRIMKAFLKNGNKPYHTDSN